MSTKGGKAKESDGGAQGAAAESDALATPVVANDVAASGGEGVGQESGNQDPSFDFDEVEEQMVLSLTDLLPDANGEVVLFSEAGHVAVNITTDERITETGTADHYVTSTGVDVSGYYFCTFEAGLTIYYSPEIDLLVTSASA
jgi:hypothetical protein